MPTASSNAVTWSPDAAAGTPLSFTNLSAGPQTIYLLGKEDSGVWQTTPTALTWTVNPALPTVVISEILAENVNALAEDTLKDALVSITTTPQQPGGTP